MPTPKQLKARKAQLLNCFGQMCLHDRIIVARLLEFWV